MLAVSISIVSRSTSKGVQDPISFLQYRFDEFFQMTRMRGQSALVLADDPMFYPRSKSGAKTFIHLI